MESKDFHERNAYVEALTATYGPAYAAVIAHAGQLRNNLDVIDVINYDRFYVGHIEGRYRALLKLEGRTEAATEILKAAPHNMKHVPAEIAATKDVSAMACAIARDIEAHADRH